MNHYSLSNELLNRTIDFANKSGEIVFRYSHDYKNKYIGIWKMSNWKKNNLDKLDNDTKYYKNLAIDEIIYSVYANIMFDVFKMHISNGFFDKNKQDYIFVILDNPNYDEYSDVHDKKYKYKLLIYKIIKYSLHNAYLEFYDIYTSTI